MSQGLSIAVIMTCYNEGAYIGAAVKSVLEQTRADMIKQIVIADDGSDAETLEALREVEQLDERILVLHSAGGLGVGGQRCKAIAQTDASVLAVLDGDDFWTKDKLEKQVDILERQPKVGLVYSDFFVFSGDDLSSARRAGVLDISKVDDLGMHYFLNDPPIIPSTTLIRRSAYEQCGGYDASIRVFEDSDFCFRAARVTRFALVDAPLLYKRTRGSSITGGNKYLMAHHAFVAMKAAGDDPRLLSLVPKRLAERARKLGNHKFFLGDNDSARNFLALSVRLNPLNWRAWMSYIAISISPETAMKLLGAKGNERRASLGV